MRYLLAIALVALVNAMLGAAHLSLQQVFGWAFAIWGLAHILIYPIGKTLNLRIQEELAELEVIVGGAGLAERQVERLVQYCTVRGYQVTQMVKEIASGITEIRPKWLGLLQDQQAD